MMKNRIEKSLASAIKMAQARKALPKFKLGEILVSRPELEKHGDYSTNLPLQLTKELRKNPREIALIIAKFLEEINRKEKLFEKIIVVKPGFINLFVARDYLLKELNKILKQGEDFGNLNIGKKQKLQVEFISANPTGPLTVGNARGGPFGDCLANVLEKAGYGVEKAYYINDYGNQILTLGHSVLRDSKAVYKGDYIDNLHKRIKDKDPYTVGVKAADIIIKEMIKKTTKRLGIQYDEWTSERKLHSSGRVDRALGYLKKKKLAYKKEGALWFKSSRFGDKRDRVIVKKDGLKTYLAGDIAYHRYKFGEKKFKKVINIWGADHHGDVPSLQAGVEALGYKGRLDIILLQFVTLYKGKKKIRMSKRGAVYITMDELLDMVGKDAVRFFFLQRTADTHLNFDISQAKEKSEKNPVFYVQYANARIHSILKKSPKATRPHRYAKHCGQEIKNPKLKLLEHPAEINLIKQLVRFPEIIEEIATSYQVQKLPKYCLDLATLFHRFYQECRVLAEKKELREARLALISATRIVLKNSLDLMGVDAPKKM